MEDRLVTRGEFLSIVGGALLGLFLIRFDSSKKVFSDAFTKKVDKTQVRSSVQYGNASYGGKKT